MQFRISDFGFRISDFPTAAIERGTGGWALRIPNSEFRILHLFLVAGIDFGNRKFRIGSED